MNFFGVQQPYNMVVVVVVMILMQAAVMVVGLPLSHGPLRFPAARKEGDDGGGIGGGGDGDDGYASSSSGSSAATSLNRLIGHSELVCCSNRLIDRGNSPYTFWLFSCRCVLSRW